MLNRLSKVKCQKVCIVMATPFHECEERSKHRERVVPHEVLVRMYKNFWLPYWYEGWDAIELVYPDNFEPYSVSDLFNRDGGLNSFEQNNPHHTSQLGITVSLHMGLSPMGAQNFRKQRFSMISVSLLQKVL